MFYAIGQDTQTIYASGSKADCMRELNRKFPSFDYRNGNLKVRTGAIEKVLPERIKIMRGK